MTEDSVEHPPAGEYGRPALRLGLGALLLAVAWLTASFFFGTSSASAAESPQAAPPQATALAGLVTSVSHTAAALSADLDRAAAPTAQVSQPAPAVPLVRSAVRALSDAVTAVPRAPVETVADVASGLVSTVAHTTDTVLPVLSRDVVGPVAGTVRDVVGDRAAAPIGHLPGSSPAIPPAPPGAEGHASGPDPVPAGVAVTLAARSSADIPANGGAHLKAVEVSVADTLRAPSVTLPAPQSPAPPAPNGTAVTAGSDAGAGPVGASGGSSAADLTRTRFLPPALLRCTAGGASILPPLSPSYDSDSTPD